MKKNNKKGFTIVELVIVIAAIGVLTAILIPTFVNLTKQAHKAEAQSFVKNVNTQLALNEVKEGKNATAAEALADADAMGFDLAKITPFEGNDIIWDEETDRFAIVTNDFIDHRDNNHVIYKDANFNLNREATKLWKLYDGMPASQTYSIVASEKWDLNVATNKDIVGLTVGFDAYNVEGISSIEYSRPAGTKQSVIIRTNEGTLTIDAPSDTIRHYNKAQLIDIKQVAQTSYDEYGNVDLAKIANGRIVVTEDAQLNNIHAVATGEGEEAYFNNIAIGVVGDASIPTITRDKVAIDDVSSEGQYSQYVLEVQSLKTAEEEATEANKDYVWVNVTVNGSGVKTKNEMIASDTAVTQETEKLNQGDNVQVEASEKPTSAAATVANNVEKAEYVTNATELQSSLDAGKKYIVFANDITASKAIIVDVDTNIDGAGYTLTTTNYQSSNARSINVGWDNHDINVSIRNLNIVGPTGSYSRGLNIANSNVKLSVFDCTVTAGCYAINVPSDGNHLELNIYDSEISGWAALNVWAFYNKITVSNSVLIGTNDKSESAWNNFATICFEADTTCETDEFGYNNTVVLKNSTIKAVETNSNIQALVSFNGGNFGATSCRLEVFDCELVQARYTLLPGGQGNSVSVDGETVWSN